MKPTQEQILEHLKKENRSLKAMKEVTDKGFRALMEEAFIYHQALQDIRKHQEGVVSGLPHLSTTWTIANRALEQGKATRKEYLGVDDEKDR